MFWKTVFELECSAFVINLCSTMGLDLIQFTVPELVSDNV
jgi:hypothetical protein